MPVKNARAWKIAQTAIRHGGEFTPRLMNSTGRWLFSNLLFLTAMATFRSKASRSSVLTVLFNFSTMARLRCPKIAPILFRDSKPIVRRKAILFNTIALKMSQAEDELGCHGTFFGRFEVAFDWSALFGCHPNGPTPTWTVAFLE